LYFETAQEVKLIILFYSSKSMDLQMQKGNQNAQSNKLWPVIKLLKKTISLDIPANTVIFIDTHACANTGCLQYGGGRAAPLVVDVNSGECIFLFFFWLSGIPYLVGSS